MKKHISRTLLIIMLAVLFVPLFPIVANAETIEVQRWMNHPLGMDSVQEYPYQIITVRGGVVRLYASPRVFYKYDHYQIRNGYGEVRTYELENGEWVYKGISNGAVYENGDISAVLETNHDIYTDSTKTEVWVNQTVAKGMGFINIDDIGLPERTMNNYIVMSQMVEGKPGTIYYHEYMEIPLFNVVSTIDSDENIYNIGWTGHGLSRAYKYNEEDSSWEFVSESKATDNWQVAVSEKKIYRTNMQIPVTGTIPEYTFPESPEGTDRIIIKSPEVPINTINDRVKIYIRMDAEVKVETKEETLKVMGVPQTEIKKIKTWSSTSTKLQHINRFSEYEITLFMPELKQYNVTILANIPETKFLGIKLLDAKTIRKELIVTRREKVDENQDGKDDTTGETGDFNYDNPGTGNGSSPPSRTDYESTLIGQFQYLTDTLNYWITAPFRLLKDGVEYIAGQAEEMFSWASNFALMIGRLFSFLPSPVLGLMGMGFAVIILIAVIKMLRG